VTTYDYFRDGQLKKRVEPLTTGDVRFGYDAAGRPNEEMRAMQSALFDEAVIYTTRKTYDKMGNVASETVVRVNPDDPSEVLTESTTESSYDGGGRLLQTVMPPAESGAERLTTNYAYDARGNRISETRTSGYETYWVYNAQGKVVQEEKPRGKPQGGNDPYGRGDPLHLQHPFSPAHAFPSPRGDAED
jgi:YD repeat-containing protein